MSAYQAAAVWAALLILLMVALAIRVIRARFRGRVSLGDGAQGELAVLSRTFGNAAEYIPVGIGALILLAAVGASATEVHLIGGGLFLGRLIHPVGLALKPPNWARVAGMALTLLSLIAAAVLLLIAAFGL